MRRILNKLLLILFISLFCLSFPTNIEAHPGRTASDGCHYCRTNCAKWGEVAGARHCHGGSSAHAPAVNPPAVTAPIVPVYSPTTTPAPVVVTPSPTPQSKRLPSPSPQPSPSPLSNPSPNLNMSPSPSPSPSLNPLSSNSSSSKPSPSPSPKPQPSPSPKIKGVSTQNQSSTREIVTGFGTVCILGFGGYKLVTKLASS